MISQKGWLHSLLNLPNHILLFAVDEVGLYSSITPICLLAEQALVKEM